jgi:hypothetical protein
MFGVANQYDTPLSESMYHLLHSNPKYEYEDLIKRGFITPPSNYTPSQKSVKQ